MKQHKYGIFNNYNYLVESYETKEQAEAECKWKDNEYVSEL